MGWADVQGIGIFILGANKELDEASDARSWHLRSDVHSEKSSLLSRNKTDCPGTHIVVPGSVGETSYIQRLRRKTQGEFLPL